MSTKSQANRVLFLNTLAFTVCFAVWTMYGVLITFLIEHRVFNFDKGQIGWLIGVPVLTGSLLRLPVGMWTDKYGGKPIYMGVMLFAALGAFFTSTANSYYSFLFGGLWFGVSGAAFAVGIAYSSIWFPKERQGLALGIFGVGNAGAALTTLGAPKLLNIFTNGGVNLEGWRTLPQVYGYALIVMTVIFALLAVPKKIETDHLKTTREMLLPLRDMRVWRFGLYYFLVFGAFVALAQWLVPYYLSVYGMSLAQAGLMASIFSLPSGVIRALGGWVSDHFGARTTMYWVLSTCALFFLLLVAPRMEMTSPGESVLADRSGVVTEVTPTSVKVDDKVYSLKQRPEHTANEDKGEVGIKSGVFPKFESWQQPSVQVGEKVQRRTILARGVTRVYFEANVWIFTILVFLAGISMGVGKAAVYKHIPEYFPTDVGVVGGLVGVIGGLGGFFCPIIFGWMLKGTGVWTTCWLFLGLLSVFCLGLMHMVIMKMNRQMDRMPPEKDSTEKTAGMAEAR